MDLEQEIFQDQPDVPDEFLKLSVEDIKTRTRLLDNEIRVLKDESTRLSLEQSGMKERIKDNAEKIKLNNTLPYLVSNIVEVLDVDPDDEDAEDGAAADVDAQRKGKCVVLKTSTRQTVFLPVVGLVDAEKLKPGDLVGVNKDSYLVLDMLPAEYDSRVKAMEVDEKPTEDYSDIGGLDKQIQELVEAIVLPVTHKERFKSLGIRPPKGVLLYGPPGTGKTLLAKAIASNIDANFLKVVSSAIVDKYIGESARLIREMFGYAREHQPCIIFMDEIDAIGGRRFSEGTSADREIQRTLMELLSQLDGFDVLGKVKMIMATNRPDVLDPALLRPGRLDRKIEIPLPNEQARMEILKIHAAGVSKHGDIDYEAVVKLADNFNGADLRNICTEAGMFAIRDERDYTVQEDYMKAVRKLNDAKKLEGTLTYDSSFGDGGRKS